MPEFIQTSELASASIPIRVNTWTARRGPTSTDPEPRVSIFYAFGASGGLGRGRFDSSAEVGRLCQFAKLIDQLSEPGGQFDSENLVSNERSYLHIVPTIRRLVDKNQAYIGVGPEQNFSYIAAARPSIAFIVDLRRDNLLLHLLYKAIFEQSRNRLDFLCLLFGRPSPANAAEFDAESLENLLGYVDTVTADSAKYVKVHGGLVDRIQRYGLTLSSNDLSTLRRIHDEFFRRGLELRYRTNFDRGNATFNPTIRQLYLETDLSGRHVSFLAEDDDFRFVQS